jgi:hypothetical protein
MNNGDFIQTYYSHICMYQQEQFKKRTVSDIHPQKSMQTCFEVFLYAHTDIICVLKLACITD